MPTFLIWILVFVSVTTQACVVTDDLGNRVNLSHPAQRIISLAPDLTETLFEIGAGNKIVGAVQGSNYPAGASALPIVANYHSLNVEKIFSLHPDLIIAWTGNSQEQLDVLKKLGVAIYISHQRNLSDIPKTFARLACLTGTDEIAAKKAQTFTSRLQQIEKNYSHRRHPVNVFFELSSRPLMTVNKESWINQMLVMCGGKNIFADLKTVAPVVSLEAVIKQNPDVILSSQRGAWKAEWQTWKELKAVHQHRLYTIEADLVERAGPRLLEGLDKICQAMHSNSSPAPM